MMLNRRFFLDTADPQFVANARNQLRGIAGPLAFLGVTTNPKAVAGYCTEQSSARAMVDGLAAEIAEFRGDTAGQLFLQLPGSNSSFEDCVRFIEHTYNWGRRHIKLGYKLPHHRVRDLAYKLQPWNHLLNVTGVTDGRTAVQAAKSPVRYISFLTGRMEERGIDAQGHVATYHNYLWYSSKCPLIAGSMRTVEQLEWCFAFNMIPTIGRSLWAAIVEKKAWRVFQSHETVKSMPRERLEAGEPEKQLSQEFFDEMDRWSLDSADRKIWG